MCLQPLAVAIDSSMRTPDMCCTGLKASVKSPRACDMCCPWDYQACFQTVYLEPDISRVVTLDLVLKARANDASFLAKVFSSHLA
jgi:hypothetical protein